MREKCSVVFISINWFQPKKLNTQIRGAVGKYLDCLRFLKNR